MRSVSKKRAKQNITYAKKYLQWKDSNTKCKVCGKYVPFGHAPHHMKGRGKYLNDTSTWLCVCMECHLMIHENATWAREKGYLE